MRTSGPFESFFKEPNRAKDPGGDCVLFHLRRDLIRLYGKESILSGKIVRQHVFLGSVGILIGIDYLSKVYSSQNQSGNAFVETVHDLINLPMDLSEATYQLRNALVHRASLSTISARKHRKNHRFEFEIVDTKRGSMIAMVYDTGSSVLHRVNFWQLKREFLGMIGKLKQIYEEGHHAKHSHVVHKVGELHSEKLLKA